MEVHHHSHTPGKKWTHYFWEFFMLFLAVTLGFIVENYREHYVEHKRTRILAASLYEDVRNDTAALNQSIQFSKMKIDSINSAVIMFHRPKKEWNDTALYTDMNIGTRVYPFERTGATYDQIKASGSLRYFKQSLVNILNAYDVQAKKVMIREDIDIKFTVEQYLPLVNNFANNEVAFDIRFGLPITHEFYYTSTDLATIRKLINTLLVLKSTRMRALQEYDELLQKATKVLHELKKEYHLSASGRTPLEE